MKITFVLTAVLIAGVFAEPPPFDCDGNKFTCFFKELAHKTKYHIGKIGDGLSEVGTAVANSALEQGKDLLINAAKASLGTLVEHLNNEGLVGKRDIAFFEKIKGHVASGISLMKEAKQAINSAFEKAVRKLTGMMGDMSGLKAIEDDADKKIDGVVEEFNKEGKKGFLAMAKAVAGKLQAIYEEGMAQIKAKFGKKMEERAILGFDSISDAWETAKGHLSNLGGQVADTFKPHIDTLTSTVSDLADKAKEHGSNLAQSALDSFNELKEKLSTHVDTLKGHAATLGDHANNAVDALKEAITAIANQALQNAASTVGDAIQTGKDAANTISDHVGDALSGSY